MALPTKIWRIMDGREVEAGGEEKGRGQDVGEDDSSHEHVGVQDGVREGETEEVKKRVGKSAVCAALSFPSPPFIVLPVTLSAMVSMFYQVGRHAV